MPTFCGASSPTRRLAEGQKCLALRTGTESPNMSPRPRRCRTRRSRRVGSTTAGRVLLGTFCHLGHLLHAQLDCHDFLVGFRGFQQFLVRSAGHDLAVVQDEDLVGTGDRGDALGDDDDRRVLGRFLQRRRAAARRLPRRGRRRNRRRGRPRAWRPRPGRCTGAGAGRRRRWCRPGRSSPSRPSSLARDEVLGLGDAQGLPQVLVAGVAPRRSAGWRRRFRRTGTAAAGRWPRAGRDLGAGQLGDGGPADEHLAFASAS